MYIRINSLQSKVQNELIIRKCTLNEIYMLDVPAKINDRKTEVLI